MVQASPVVEKRFSWLPHLRREIWILAVGQLLLFMGQGFTMVYTSIYFVNALGFSATQVGLALGSGSISGTLSRFWAGNAIDSPLLGRRKTLFLSTVVTAIACFCLALTTTFPMLVLGNLLLGIGSSLYWPATMAVTADLTTGENRTEGFALTRLADNVGLGLGALLAGQYIAWSGSYPALFFGKGIAYLICGVIIYLTIAETLPHQPTESEDFAYQPLADDAADAAVVLHGSGQTLRQWGQALRDRPFLLYLAANMFFTTFVAQLSSTLPLYLVDFVPGGNAAQGFSEQWISYLFGVHALLKIVLQMPVTRWLKPFHYSNLLLTSSALWMVGFTLVWLAGLVPTNAIIPIAIAFSFVAMAEVIHAPAAMSIVGELAPESARGVYFSLESQTWALGFLIGPAVGGWTLDHGATWGSNLWLVLTASSLVSAVVLVLLKRQGQRQREAEVGAMASDAIVSDATASS
ncbi:MAG: MFS transporter [Cyanothece sp. SIO2G6]|nr:MFS transporter [Cyanothece sp. SIO2G6]